MSDENPDAPSCPPEPSYTRADRLRLWLPEFGIQRPGWTLLITAVLALAALWQFPKVNFDNDPENMLAEDEPVRVFHRQVKARYALYDFVIAGVVNDADPDGIFNPVTLTRLYRLTGELTSLRRGPDGLPQVRRVGPDGGESYETVDLRPAGWWARVLAVAFRQDANRLFTPDGDSAIIARELISPSLVDNIKQAERGSLKMEYLMERPPATREEALVIKRDAMENPLYNGTLVSEDGQAVCLYIPLADKTYSHNTARLVEALTRDWDGPDRLYITGQPVAQDTFGVEMLVQMATSAPLAGLAIFLLLLLFFRRVQLIVAPMLIAMLSVIAAMGLLIGLGYDVHIMSSMIAIFLMPIAVADSVHILSEFFDTYHRYGDKARTIRHVIRHLFQPMLYTSLTTIAGFASLAWTPIPPVRVFGLHVAFGVAMAWLLTMVFAPAYIMLGVSRRTLARLKGPAGGPAADGGSAGPLNAFLGRLGRFSHGRARLIVVAVLVVLAWSAVGVTRIRVNDNPIKWFSERHAIREADRALNAHFGGTYTAYLTLGAARPDAADCGEKAVRLKAEAAARFGAADPAGLRAFQAAVDKLEPRYRDAARADLAQCFHELAREAERLDGAAAPSGWSRLADAIQYMDPVGLTRAGLLAAVKAEEGVDAALADALDAALADAGELEGGALQDAALAACEARTPGSYRDFVFEMQAELSAPLFKRPALLRWLRDLQEHLEKNPVVGKTSTAADALIKAAYELNYRAAPDHESDAARAARAAVNEGFRAVPPTAAGVGQVFTQLEGMKRKDSLFHMVTRDYQEANVWVQLKSGDNVDMENALRDAESFLRDNPPPVPLNTGWAGLTYLNVVWQDRMVTGMISSLAGSFIIVLLMMMVLFRSPVYGLLAMIPLSVTILFIYGLIGWAGKDYDMPIAILSSLTLGLSVDFAIHFLERAREERKRCGTWAAAAVLMFREPAVAISRNAITISVGFLPLLAAPLVPYRTVGFFLAAIMAVSWLATLFILPALLTLLRRRIFAVETTEPGTGGHTP